jgi:WD40 repeat protein
MTVAMAADAPDMAGWVSHYALEAEPTAFLWHGVEPLVTLGDGTVWTRRSPGQDARIPAHAGAILAACRHPDGQSLVTGGDDGRVCKVSPGDEVQVLGTLGSKWVDHLVASPASGVIVAAVGREAIVWGKDQREPSHRFQVNSTIGGLAMEAKGKRLAIAHYGGATMLYAANPQSGRIQLDWVGSHIGCTFSANGQFLITALQETGLHGWQLPAMRDMRMSGYAAKTRSFSWDRRGKWLATGGDDSAIVWPFEGKTGPMGKAPLLRGKRKGAIVTRVAFHPHDEVLAAGYDDGAVMLLRLSHENELLIDQGETPVATLAWNDAGTRLGWACEGGRIGILDAEARG